MKSAARSHRAPPGAKSYRKTLLLRLGGFALALAIGTIGGAIFNHFQLPLAWMLGAMTACTIAAVSGLPLAAFDEIRPFMIATIGVLLGAGFAPGLLGDLLNWVPTLLGLVAYIVIGSLAGTAYFCRIGKFALPTAFFAAMPGGFLEMITLGDERGGDARMIALVHSARVLLVVMSLPYFMILLFPVEAQSMRAGSGTSIVATPLSSHLWLVTCALLGMWLGRLLRLPARYLLGPMLLSGAVHMSSTSNFQPSTEIVIAAQLFLGTSVGCRFAGISARQVLKVLVLSVGSVAILMSAAAAASYLLAWLTPIRPEALLLAYSPGGLTETSLIALSMGLDVALIASHHVARVLIVLLVAVPIFAAITKVISRSRGFKQER